MLQVYGLVLLWDSWWRGKEWGCLSLSLLPPLGTLSPADLPYPALSGEDMPSFSATSYARAGGYTWEACTFVEGKKREWMVRGR